ncbi:MAG: hypothetical protein ACLFV4_12175 [Candidatus Hydrogenedentota bacterium]
MRIYKHRQPATLLHVTFGVGLAVSIGAFMLAPESRLGAGAAAAMLAVGAFLFHALTVEVSRNEVVAAFGPGLIRKRFRIDDIKEVKPVRNPWYYGWGIRLIPHGWMFNVSGLEAVEMHLKNGKKFRIGTDDPQGLTEAIRNAREGVEGK